MVGKFAVAIVGHHGDLERVLQDDVVVRVCALDGLEPIGTANSSAGGGTVLDHDQAWTTVGVEVVGVADFGGGDDAMGLEETVVEDPIIGFIFPVGVDAFGKAAGSKLVA